MGLILGLATRNQQQPLELQAHMGLFIEIALARGFAPVKDALMPNLAELDESASCLDLGAPFQSREE